MSALALNAIPIDREVTGRKSSDMFRDLLADGHSLLIYPEGGRSPDGWGQSVQGRRRVPVVTHRARRWCRCTSTAPAPSSARA